MQHSIDKHIALPNVTVQTATVTWQGIEETPPYQGYSLSQRLSVDHPPLRIGNFPAPSVLPRVHSIGLLPPGKPIRLLPVAQPLRVLLCLFNENHFEAVTEAPRSKWEAHTESLVAMRNKRLEIMMQEVYAELEQPGFGSELLIESVTTIVMVELGRLLRQLERRQSGNRKALPLAPWQLKRIQDRVASGAETGYPNLGELAKLCGVSEGHLGRAFKAATGWQIHKYVADERIKAARKLLANQHMSCEAVAKKLGFSSAAYFSTAFRKVTGKSPGEYRRQAISKP